MRFKKVNVHNAHIKNTMESKNVITYLSERVKCAKCGYEFSGLQIRKCPYSKRGLHVCVYCCKSCPYVKQIKLGCICTYQKD